MNRFDCVVEGADAQQGCQRCGVVLNGVHEVL
jgi:hypothetical protein